jgi:hypothetical protein
VTGLGIRSTGQWTDSDTKRIEFAGLSGLESDMSVLFWDDRDLLRAISVAPEQELMFWIDWGEDPQDREVWHER